MSEDNLVGGREVTANQQGLLELRGQCEFSGGRAYFRQGQDGKQYPAVDMDLKIWEGAGPSRVEDLAKRLQDRIPVGPSAHEWEDAILKALYGPISAVNAQQPLSIPNDSTAIWNLVLADIHERDRAGALKYGTRLQANNGRDCLVDAYQESLDLVVYLRQKIEEERQRRSVEETPLPPPMTINEQKAEFNAFALEKFVEVVQQATSFCHMAELCCLSQGRERCPLAATLAWYRGETV